ncbi:MAG TPA: NAD-binding protein, partial [Tepidisphaeraceae bacterium]|nr:NAD-binding protein [Tepidisphaeraceae bacterium]
EGLALARRLSLSDEWTLDVILAGSAASPVVTAVAPRMVAGAHDPRFALRLAAKDPSYAVAAGADTARRSARPPPTRSPAPSPTAAATSTFPRLSRSTSNR